MDYDPRLESFWCAGGINPPESIKRYRRGNEWQKDSENDPVDRPIQYFGFPIITLRANQPLLPIISLSEAENPALEVPHFPYDPRVLNITMDHRHGVNLPGD